MALTTGGDDQPLRPDTQAEWPRRTARAAATRRSILDAARDLFIDQGYVRTTVPAIAERAGVSRATVFNSVRTKAEVLRACYDVAIVGDDEPLPLYARPEMLAMLAESDPRLSLRLYAAIICGIGARVSPLVEVLRAAAAADDDIRIMWHEIQSERLYGASRFVQTLAGKTPLRPGLTQTRAADLVWTLIDNSLYHKLVHERGWPPAEFQKWLSSTFIEQLLPQ